MNEFTAKKIGEVIAFAQVGNATILKAKSAFSEFMAEDEVKNAISKSEKHIDALLAFATEKNIIDIVKSKAEKTGTKITSMRDAYIGDEWGNPAEIFEWWGFFGGGAIVHWNLLKGIAETIEDDVLAALTYDGIAYHESLYDSSSALLTEIGRNRAL